VFGNFRFISFLVIFSGFWIMFWQIFYSFPFYILEVLQFERFELLETVDAWTIILVSIPMTALVKKWRPITAMTLGFALASFSWLIIAGSPTITAAIIGVAPFLRSARQHNHRDFMNMFPTSRPRIKLEPLWDLPFYQWRLAPSSAAHWVGGSYKPTCAKR
jgi:hypothetical protein